MNNNEPKPSPWFIGKNGRYYRNVPYTVTRTFWKRETTEYLEDPSEAILPLQKAPQGASCFFKKGSFFRWVAVDQCEYKKCRASLVAGICRYELLSDTPHPEYYARLMARALVTSKGEIESYDPRSQDYYDLCI